MFVCIFVCYIRAVFSPTDPPLGVETCNIVKSDHKANSDKHLMGGGL